MATPPGWHPDPSGRHQHRFWDGNAWTDEVADDGRPGIDPLPPVVPGVVPTPGPVAAPAPAGRPGDGRGRVPLVVGIVVVVAVVVAGAIVLLARDGEERRGAGDFTYDVGTERLVVHEVSLKAGQFLVWGVDRHGDHLRAAEGVAADDAERFAANPVASRTYFSGPMTTVADRSNEIARSLFDGLPGHEDLQRDLRQPQTHPLELPGFEGTLIAEAWLGSPQGIAAGFVAPIDLTFAIVLIADRDETVHLRVRVSNAPDTDGDLSTDDFTDLFTQGYLSDFTDTIESDFADLGGTDAASEPADDGLPEECRVDLDTIRTAIDAWHVQYGSDIPGDIFDTPYPTSMADLADPGGGPLERPSHLYDVTGSGARRPTITTLDPGRCPPP